MADEYRSLEAIMDALLHEQYGYLCEDAIKRIPAADVAPVRHGRWKPLDLTYGRSVYYCTACNHSAVVPTAIAEPTFNYCPNCGAKMDGGEEP